MLKKISLLLFVGYWGTCNTTPRLLASAFKSITSLSHHLRTVPKKIIQQSTAPLKQLSNAQKVVVAQVGLVATAGAINVYYGVDRAIYNYSAPTPYYSINFMWINRYLKDTQQFIAPADNEKEARAGFLKPVFEWAHANPKALVILWYSSQTTPPEAIKKTQEIIAQENRKHRKRIPIQLQDVRTLDYVKQNPEVFSDKTPVYFRADLARVIATVETLEKSYLKYFVYNDLDVQDVMNEKELFDTQTQQYLDEFGIVMRDREISDFENQFHIVARDNPNLFEALKYLVIELNIVRAYNALKGECYNSLNRCTKDPMEPLQQIVFSSYFPMFEYYYHLQRYGTLRHYCSPHKVYDKKTDGYKPFGVDRYKHKTLKLEIPKKNKRFQKDDEGLWYPTKEVNFPPPRHSYN